MADVPRPPFDRPVPDAIGPAISYSSVSRAAERARRLLDSLAEKVRRQITDGLQEAGQAGAAAETKTLAGIATGLTGPEEVLGDLASVIQNAIAGKLAPAVAHLQDLGFPVTTSPTSAPGMTTSAETPVIGVEGLTSGVPSIVTGDANKGRSGGALSATEQLLGSDPEVVDGTVQLQGSAIPPAAPAPGGDPCPISPDLHDAMQSAIDNIGSQSKPQPGDNMIQGQYAYATDQCCMETVPFNDPNQLNPPVPPERIFFYRGWQSSMSAAFEQATQIWPGWNALGQCGGGQPQPPQQPFPIVNVPISGPPPPPPPPPECCPPPPPCPPCPSLVLPECVHVDLCDWEQLCKTLKDCLTQTAASGDCALDNETAYVYKDCDGTFSDSNTSYYGSIGGVVDSINSLDDTLPAFFAGFPDMDSSLFLGAEPVTV